METKKINSFLLSGKAKMESLSIPLIAVAFGLFAGGIIIAASGGNPFTAYKQNQDPVDDFFGFDHN